MQATDVTNCQACNTWFYLEESTPQISRNFGQITTQYSTWVSMHITVGEKQKVGELRNETRKNGWISSPRRDSNSQPPD